MVLTAIAAAADVAEKAVETASSTPNLLTMDASIVFTFINILILFLFLRWKLFGPVNKILEERKKLVNANIEAAEKEKAEAKALKEEYQKVLDKADEESVQIIKEAKERAQIEYNKQVDASRAEAGRLMEEANRAIELEKKRSMEQAQSEIAGIALLAAQKVIQKNVDADDNKKLIGDFLQEAGASK